MHPEYSAEVVAGPPRIASTTRDPERGVTVQVWEPGVYETSEPITIPPRTVVRGAGVAIRPLHDGPVLRTVGDVEVSDLLVLRRPGGARRC